MSTVLHYLSYCWRKFLLLVVFLTFWFQLLFWKHLRKVWLPDRGAHPPRDFFLSVGKCRDLAGVTKNHHYIVHGPYFDPMTPPLGVLKSESRTSTHLGSIPGRVSYSTPAPFWRLYMQYTQLGISHWGTRGSPRADSWTFCLYWQKAVGPGIRTHHPPPQLKSNV